MQFSVQTHISSSSLLCRLHFHDHQTERRYRNKIGSQIQQLLDDLTTEHKIASKLNGYIYLYLESASDPTRLKRELEIAVENDSVFKPNNPNNSLIRQIYCIPKLYEQALLITKLLGLTDWSSRTTVIRPTNLLDIFEKDVALADQVLMDITLTI
ncbi:hypothetical protein H3C67_01070 [Candidatus Dojkabacteria bacterium]|uniref:Uncharacterized protein n=2 Tax=Candidatus Dojkabacteria TaxID=74243 RepID=A0A136KFT5_9BACT|nr:MAG: hypothetical protein UZ20_WS6002000802 [candidate division WS6 bacterium OLB21]MBW7953355.1 hypothetical protein [Candidatus Dojkabacteria bacterium]